MVEETYEPIEIEYAFNSFVKRAEAMVKDYYTDHYTSLELPDLVVRSGRKYWKIIKGTDESGWTVWGFVRKEDGAMFKPASWNAPFTKGPSAIRGYVTGHSNGMNSVTPYGVVYAK
tara:strand:+ start:247 stop:594 length:348 start_codon:yes stop_codon:yes gene_type:complete